MNSSFLVSELTLSSTHAGVGPTTLSRNGEVDYIARVSGSTAAQSIRYVCESKEFADSIQRYMETKESEISSLVKAVDWQHKTIEYNSVYTAFLLGQIEEEEFEEAACALAEKREPRSLSEIGTTIINLLKLTKVPFTTSDFASMFNCPEEIIRKAITATDLKVNRLKDME